MNRIVVPISAFLVQRSVNVAQIRNVAINEVVIVHLTLHCPVKTPASQKNRVKTNIDRLRIECISGGMRPIGSRATSSAVNNAQTVGLIEILIIAAAATVPTVTKKR